MDMKERLPKLIPGYIVRYWYLNQETENVIPDDIPDTSSVFSTEYKTEVEKAAAEALVAELEAGSSSVFVESELPANAEYGEFLGVYEVEANLNELTLASPVKVAPYTESAVVKHYNDETETWENVNDVQIIDGYVYAVFTDLSPVSVMTIRRKVYMSEDGKYFVANGLPITISAGSVEGEVSITDVFGNVHTVSSEAIVVGGTYNEAGIVEETSVNMEGGIIDGIVAGSVNFTEEQAFVKKTNVIVADGILTAGVRGGGYGRCRVDESNVAFNGGKAYYVAGGGVSSAASLGGDVNAGVADENSPAYTMDTNLVVNGGEIEYLYGGGTSGYQYAKEVSVKITGGKMISICPASNGIVDNLIIDIEAGEIEKVYATNRGIVKVASWDVSGGVIQNLYLGGDHTDSTITGEIGEVSAVISGGTVNVFAGASKAVKIVPADGIIKEVKVAEAAAITYMENFDTEFADVIKTV